MHREEQAESVGNQLGSNDAGESLTEKLQELERRLADLANRPTRTAKPIPETASVPDSRPPSVPTMPVAAPAPSPDEVEPTERIAASTTSAVKPISLTWPVQPAARVEPGDEGPTITLEPTPVVDEVVVTAPPIFEPIPFEAGAAVETEPEPPMVEVTPASIEVIEPAPAPLAAPSTELVPTMPETMPGTEATPRRWRAWVAVLCAALAVAAAVWMGAAGAEGFTSTARVAAVDELFFDYADANRDRMIGRVEADTERLVIEPNGINDVRFVRPDLQTFVDVEVTATLPEAAQQAANQLAQKMVDEDLAALISPLQRRDEALADQLSRLTSEIATLDAAIEESIAVEAFAEANRWNGDSGQLESLTIELREAQDDRDRGNRRRSALAAVVVEVEAEREQIETQVARYEADGVVVRPAVLGTKPSLPFNVLLAITAFVGVTAAGAGLLTASRSRKP